MVVDQAIASPISTGFIAAGRARVVGGGLSTSYLVTPRARGSSMVTGGSR